MNKSTLRNFAVWARRDLIKRISDRANLLGVYEDKPTKEIQATTEKGFVVNGVTFNYKKEIRDAFVKRVHEIGYQDTIEEIAYTWFNRIVALRFMEVNGYLTNGKNGEKIYIIGSTIEGKNEPDALTNADKLSFVDKFVVYDYQDANDNNGLYRYILTKQCNDLNKSMPLMFEKIEDYAELLLPDHLLDKGAIIDHLVNDISAKDFNITIKDDDGENASQVEIVGWLYQFYISEKKEDVFAGLKNNTKITKGTLPAATQIFTPDWIVRYMTDNTLGKMWVESRNSNLKKELKYYLEPAEQTDEVKAKLAEINKQYAEKRVTDITFIDPCCGSGHILVYAFDLFYKMYLESGYVSNEIPSLILKNNLVGIDVDKRAVQLTSFALTMKAVSYDKDFLTKQVYPNVIDMKESNSLNQNEVKEFISLSRLSNEDEEVVEEVIEKFRDAELYGSLIKDFRYSPERYDVVLKYIQNNVDPDAVFNLVDRVTIINTKPLICDLLKEAIILSSKYYVVVTNPPYMKSGNMNNKLVDFIENYYIIAKSDFYAPFILRINEMVKKYGLNGIVTPSSWFANPRFDKFRSELFSTISIHSLLELGDDGFDVGFGTQCMVYFAKVPFLKSKNFDLTKVKEKQSFDKHNYYIRSMEDYRKFNKLSYKVSNKLSKVLIESNKICDIGNARSGLQTNNNALFIKNWFEVNNIDICFDYQNNRKFEAKWCPHIIGGTFRKWYGNMMEVLYWKNNGEDIISLAKKLYTSYTRTVKSQEHYFKPCISWSHSIYSQPFSARKTTTNAIFNVEGPSLFDLKQNENYVLGLLNSKITKLVFENTLSSIHVLASDVANFPLILNEDYRQIINKEVEECVNLAKFDWDQYETSWDFKKSPLI